MIEQGFHGGSDGKESGYNAGGSYQVVLVVRNSTANAGDIRHLGSIHGSGRPLGGEHGNSLQYSCLENPMGKEAWWATVHRVKRKHNMHACTQFRRLWFDPGVGTIPWRRERQLTLVFLPGKSYGQRSLVGFNPWGCKESDMTKQPTYSYR